MARATSTTSSGCDARSCSRRRGPPADTCAVRVAANTWLRRRSRTVAFAACAFAGAAFWAWLLVHIAGDRTFLRHNGGLAPFGLFFGGVALLHAAAGWRLARWGLWIGPDRVVVRGLFRTRTVALQEVAGIEPGALGQGSKAMPCPLVRLADGRALGVLALGSDGSMFSYQRRTAEMQPLCKQLNELLLTVRLDPQPVA